MMNRSSPVACKRPAPIQNADPPKKRIRTSYQIVTRSQVHSQNRVNYRVYSIESVSGFFSMIKGKEKSALENLLAFCDLLPDGVANELKSWVNSILYFDERKIQDYGTFVDKLSAILDEVEYGLLHFDPIEKVALKKVHLCLQRIAYTFLTQNNARRVHADLVSFVKRTQCGFFPRADRLIAQAGGSGLTRRLAITWDQATELMRRLKHPQFGLQNIPNQTFELQFPEHKILFIRYATPEHGGKTPFNIYEAMLEAIDRKGKVHMDLSLLRLSGWEHEVKINNERRGVHEIYAGSVVPWAFDLYSNFSSRLMSGTKILESCSTREFKKQLILKLMNKEFAILPYSDDREGVAGLVNLVEEDFFEGRVKLTRKEMVFFIDMTMVYLFESICEKVRPSTCSTACRCHIDRGMYFMTVLYYYILCKKQKDRYPDYIDYMETMIFAPSLLFYQRPTHENVMTRLLATLYFLQNAGGKFRARETYFSGADVRIPEK